MNISSSSSVQALFKKAKKLIEEKEYRKAVPLLKKLVKKDPDCWEGLVNLGLSYCELGEYDEAIKTYDKIPDEKWTSKTWFNVGIAQYYRHSYRDAFKAYTNAIDLCRVIQQDILPEAHFNLGVLCFEVGDITNATTNVSASLLLREDLASAWALKGRINIENNECDEAILNFERAVQNFKPATASDYSKNLSFLIWEAYARYLKVEFSPPTERESHLVIVIRKLERVDALANKLGEEEIRAHALYFLACFYCKQGDPLTAKKKLEECISLKSSAPVKNLARELLENLWDQKIRPPWWRWWRTSTSKTIALVKTMVFLILNILMIAMILILFAHPFISHIPRVGHMFPEGSFHWQVYLFTIALLIIIILSPSIEQVKAKDIEVKVQAPVSLEIIPSSAQMEQAIGAMSIETIITSVDNRSA